jgi:RNA methyltransferase, TrmH family
MISKAKLKEVSKLSQKKYRDSEELFLVEGVRSVNEALSAGAGIVDILVTDEVSGTSEITPIIQRASQKGTSVTLLAETDFSRLSDVMNSQGIAAIVRNLDQPAIEAIAAAERDNAFIVALDAVADPGNLGAVIRTCDWFGVSAILLGRGSVELYNPKVVRATMGSIFHLPVLQDVDLSRILVVLKNSGWDVIAAELNGAEDIRSIRRGKRTVLVIGNEAHGISPEVSRAASHHVSIPSFGSAESLNAGIAAGVFLSYFMLHHHDH